MNVEQLMSHTVTTCSSSDTLDCAARIMWERDCGIVPIVDAEKVVGVITDRDICIAAYTQGKLLEHISISDIASKPVVSVRPQDSADEAEGLMRKHQIRRVVVTDEGGGLVGLLSLNDIARRAERKPSDLSSDDVAKTLAAISQPRTAAATA
jgi:CBS domain-containing protein